MLKPCEDLVSEEIETSSMEESFKHCKSKRNLHHKQLDLNWNSHEFSCLQSVLTFVIQNQGICTGKIILVPKLGK